VKRGDVRADNVDVLEKEPLEKLLDHQFYKDGWELCPQAGLKRLSSTST
jgi:hypothetical protein